MSEFMKQPQECIYLDVGRITALQTRQNSNMRDPFTPVDIMAMEANQDVLAAFIADMMVASPTAGFSVEIKGKVFNHPVTWQAELKIKSLFTTPRSGGYSKLIGIDADLIAGGGSNWMQVKTCLDLTHSPSRWSLPHYYMLGDAT